jgi:hypothetical protein
MAHLKITKKVFLGDNEFDLAILQYIHITKYHMYAINIFNFTCQLKRTKE